MNSDFIRYGLLAGLALVGYLLVLAWNDDYGGPPAGGGQAAQTDPILSQSPKRDNEQPTMPTEGPTQTSSRTSSKTDSTAGEANTEVPAAKAGAGNRSQSDTSTPAPEASGTLIRVHTDVLDVWIDRRGGDIVKVTLPQYPVALKQPDNPFVLLTHTPQFVYIAQSGLTGRDGPDAGSGGRPLYRAGSGDYRLAPNADVLEVPLTYRTDAGVEITKVFRFRRGNYRIGIAHEITNRSSAPFEANLYGQFKRDGGKPPNASRSGMGPRPYVGPAYTPPDGRYEKVSFDDVDEAPFEITVANGWIAMLQHYFLSAWIPGEDDAEQRYFARQAGDNRYLVGFVAPPTRVAPGATDVVRTSLYAGPKIQDRLESIASNLNLTVDYGILWWISVPLFQLLEAFHGLVGNWGFAIILLTITVKVVLFPLSAAAYRSMAKMRRFAPELRRLQERHGDDRQKLSQEMMNLYRKERINPVGGCLPMLLQMPVFIALYWVLYESVELRQAPFILWINDLSTKDPYFVLPLLMGASMFLQQQLNPSVPDPTQQKIMKLMPIMFTGLFLFFPAGLVLYWLVNNVLSMTQQWYVMRQVDTGDVGAAGR